MEWNKQKIKGLLLVVCGGVAFYCALQRLDAVLAALGWLLGILAPFLLGGALAMLLSLIIVPVVSLFTKSVPFEVNLPSPEGAIDREYQHELAVERKGAE